MPVPARFPHPLFSCVAPLTLLAALVAGCGDKNATAQTPGSAPGAGGTPPPAEVAIVTVAPQRVALINELPGRVEASRTAQVRARVPGIVQQRVFEEGSNVKSGQLLFRIDPAPFRAALSSAEATLARAEANLAQANLQVKRFKPLVEEAAISRQEFDTALTAQKQAQADVAAAKAAKQTASLNLGYATVNAPISGRIGRAQVTEGALVGQGEATPLATIQQLDPVYVNLTQSSTELMNLRRALAEGKLEKAGPDQAKITLLSQDGQPLGQTGTLLFSDVTVDPGTGSVTLRATVPNKERTLLPGMFVRAQVRQAVQEAAILIPQQALIRNTEGASVMVVGSDNKVVSRQVAVSSAQGNDWIIRQGLKPGDQVVVEGLQKAKPGATVKPVAWTGPTGTAAAPNGSAANGGVAAQSGNAAANNPSNADGTSQPAPGAQTNPAAPAGPAAPAPAASQPRTSGASGTATNAR